MHFSSTSNNAVLDATTELDAAEDHDFMNTAIREVSWGKRKNIRYSPQKMNELCRLVRGLSVEEAVIQLGFSVKDNHARGALTACIKTAAAAGVNNFYMDKSRLVISHASSSKAKYGKKLRTHAKGQHSIMNVYYCHLNVGISEQPYEADEKRIGKWGRNISTIENTLKLIQSRKERKIAKSERRRNN
jgi:large subunit ribosomal protein L22